MKLMTELSQRAVGLLATLWAVPSWAAAVSGQGTWESTLHPRYFDGDATADAYYDTALNVTWLADANYAGTSGYDADGRMSWARAADWAANLSVGGATGWRLPATGPIDGSAYDYSTMSDGTSDIGYNISAPGTAFAGGTASELAHMFYVTLGNLAACDTSGTCPQPGWGLSNTGPFVNVMAGGYWDIYWSGSPFGGYPDNRWHFDFANGYQGEFGKDDEILAWAVHAGDVGSATPVPVPAAVWLLGSGLLGLAGVARRRRSAPQ